MTALYFILYVAALLLLLADTFTGSHAGSRFSVRLLPLALAFVVLVQVIRTGKAL